MPENTKVLDLILNQLEKLTENQEKLTQEIQKTNIELAKIGGLRHAVSDFKEWKDNMAEVVNIDDLKKMKEFYLEHQDVGADVTDLYLITKELRTETEDYKKFKIKTMTIIAVVSFILTTGMVIMGWFIK